jgi:hypothetical protein
LEVTLAREAFFPKPVSACHPTMGFSRANLGMTLPAHHAGDKKKLYTKTLTFFNAWYLNKFAGDITTTLHN